MKRTQGISLFILYVQLNCLYIIIYCNSVYFYLYNVNAWQRAANLIIRCVIYDNSLIIHVVHGSGARGLNLFLKFP